ncbi:MAG: nuclear transport factor 2 family protein [Erythrobacter sp.]
MGDFSTKIKTIEHRMMRAWVRRDQRELRSVLGRNFMMIVGAGQSQLLDRPSFLEAAEGRLSCSSYSFREVVVRKHGSCAWFAAGVDLEMRLGARDWSGKFWLTDMWRKGKFGRTWKLVERSLSRIDPEEALPAAIQNLQLWN